MKRCRKCEQMKPFEQFEAGPRYKDGYRHTCKRCRLDQAKARRVPSERVGTSWTVACANPECGSSFTYTYLVGAGRPKFCSIKCKSDEWQSRKGRNSRLKRYGMDEDSYAALLALQGDCCAICRRPASTSDRPFAVDHDHGCCSIRAGSCGRCVRGILCATCNNALGAYEKSGFYPPGPWAEYATTARAHFYGGGKVMLVHRTRWSA